MSHKLKTNKMKKIRNKNGFTSEYGFMCGYIENIQTETTKITMYREHGVYHVQAFRNDKKTLMTRNDCKIWETYEKLTDAKKHYKKLLKIFTN